MDFRENHNSKQSMCRSYNNVEFINPLEDSEDFQKEIYKGRGNVGVVTINFPKIAIESGGDWNKFYELLHKYTNMTIDILDWRYNYAGEARAESNPLMWMEGGAWRRLNHDEKISKTIFNFTASVGIIGFNEALNYMYLNNGYEVDNLPNYKSGGKRQQDQIKFMEVLNSIKEFRNIHDAVRIDEDGVQTRVWDDEGSFVHPDPDKKYLEVYEKLDTTRKTTIIPRMYSVYGTPAESLVYKMMKQLQKQYGFINGVTAQEDGKGRNYITNSFHQPVWIESNVFDKIDFEAPFHLDKMASGGHISQNEFAYGTPVTVLEQTVRYAMEKGMYYGINIASSHCFDCGWNGETADTCAECGSENVVTIQRVCFTGENLVFTDKGYVKIKDIKEGDKVWTMNKRFKPVVQVGKKEVEKTINLKISGTEEVISTLDHPFFAKKDKNSETELIEAQNLTKDSYIAVPINQESIVPKVEGLPVEDKDFWWLVGRYLGDGWVTQHSENSIRSYICVGKDDSNGIEKIQYVIDKFNLGYTDKRETRTTYIWSTFNKTFNDFMKQMGHGAENKQIPVEWLNLPIDLARELLYGYLSADGCVHNNKQICNSVSRKLLYGIGQLVLKVENKGYTIYKNRDAGTMEIEGRTVNTKARYDLKFSLGKPAMSFVQNGYAFFRVRGSEIVEKNDTVYSLTVLDDASYTIQNLLVKNCGYLSITSRNGHSVVNAGKTEELLERVNHVGNAKKEYTKNFEKNHDIQRDIVSKEFSMFESGE
ncbi:MAG: Hint domain-containing protein [Staphylococcus equorum]|nr:Hint domain-containing protein [Tetragenococcus halophilus]MDN6749041.1 Hint domain-containing protein [Staphylococcus equorum]